MQARRFEHPDKARFFEVFWERGVVEITSGSLGSKGRTREHQFAMAGECEAFIDDEIAKRVRQGFVEVVPEVVRAQAAPHVAPQADWIAAIAAAFDDDEPRLVYADFLQSKGDPLGELIAVQCELARREPWEPEAAVLRERAETLLVTYRPRWLPKVSIDAQCTFHRGFVERVAIPDGIAREAIENLMLHAPLIRTLELDERGSWRPQWNPWAVAPDALLRQLTGLVLRGFRLDPHHVRAIVEQPALVGLDRLAARSCNVRATDAAVLGGRAWRELDLHQSVLGLRGTHGVLADVSRLEVLDVGSSGIGDPGALAIAAAPFVRLRRLCLRRSQLTSASLRPLSRAPRLARTLAALDLSCNVDVGALFADPELPALVELDLRETALDDEALTGLLASPLAAQLRVLDLGGNRLTDARLLLEAELPALRVLNVSGNSLGERARELKVGLPHVRVTARNAA